MFKQGNVTVMVSDMKRSIQFYSEVLGFTKGAVYGDEWAEIGAPGLKIGLHPMKKDAKPPLKEGNVSMGFEVDDLDEVTDVLSKRGIQFTYNDDTAVRIASFQDPDKNPLYVCEVKY